MLLSNINIAVSDSPGYTIKRVGHNAVFTNQKTDYLVFHGYDASDKGILKLRTGKLNWDSSGWTVVEISE